MKNKILKRITLAMVMILSISMFIGCGKSATSKDGAKGKIVVGSKTFTENIILGKIMVKYLQNNGYEVVDETGLGETGIIRQAITSDEIDAYFEYTGTAVMQFMQHDAVFDSDEAYKLIKDWDKKNGLVWLDYAKANNTYCIAVNEDIAKKYNLEKVSDLAAQYNKGEHIKFVTAAESYERPDVMPRLFSTYNFNIDKSDRIMLDLGLFYDALKNGEADATTGFKTDGRIKVDKLAVLEDDKNAFAAYNIAPVFRQEIIDENPEIEDLMKNLTDKLTNEVVTELNSKVDVEKREINDVVDEFLKENELIK